MSVLQQFRESFLNYAVTNAGGYGYDQAIVDQLTNITQITDRTYDVEPSQRFKDEMSGKSNSNYPVCTYTRAYWWMDGGNPDAVNFDVVEIMVEDAAYLIYYDEEMECLAAHGPTVFAVKHELAELLLLVRSALLEVNSVEGFIHDFLCTCSYMCNEFIEEYLKNGDDLITMDMLVQRNRTKSAKKCIH